MYFQKVVKFKYTEVVADHLRYRGAVDNHSSLNHYCGTKYQIGLKSAWRTNWWHIRIFAFFIAFTEVNAYLAMQYLLKMEDTFLNFRKI